MNIPDNESELTDIWIGAALESSFRGIGNDLDSVEVERVGVGVGLIASIYRCHLKYKAESPSYPSSVVLKMPSSDADSLKLAKTMELYKREHHFYTKIAPLAKIRTPRLFHGAYERKSNNFVLVFEDLDQLNAGDQLIGATAEQTLAAMEAIGRFHAQFLNRPKSTELKDVYQVSPLTASIVQFVYRENVELAIQRFKQYFTPDLERVARTYGKRTTELMTVWGNRNVTYIHGDYRLDNLFFDRDGKVVALDWQVSAIGGALFDVAYFLSGSVSVDTRREVEREAIQVYCQALSEGSADEIPFDDVWSMYRQAVLACLLTAIIVSGGLDLIESRSNDIVVAGLRRTLTAIADLGSDEFLDVRPKLFSSSRFLNAFVNGVIAIRELFRRN